MKSSSTQIKSGDIQYFKEILKKVGITLNNNEEEPNVYEKESFLIVKDLKNELGKHENFPHNLPEFLKGVKYISSKKETYFKNALMPSVMENGKKQDCLIRVFLLVDCLQDEIIKCLLQEVIPHVIEQDETNWLRLLMGPLRFLSFIKEPQALSESILELLESGTEGAQLELLTYIPEILPDSEYENCARKILGILKISQNLVAAIIDCLDCLRLSSTLKEEIQDQLLVIMDRAGSLENFPLIIQFLVADCKAQSLIHVLTKTRLAINNVILKQNSQNALEESNQVITFEQLLKISIGKVADGWLQVISNLKTQNDHRPIDLLILLMLHSVNLGREKAIETLIKRKIKLKHFTANFVQNTIQNYLPAQIYNEYLRSIETIASHLVFTHGDPNYVEIAHAMYRAVFLHKHADVPSRKEILESIMCWPPNGGTQALTLLQEFSSHDPKLLIPHLLNLFNLLDKLRQVSLSEAAQIFDFLCSIVWSKTNLRETPDQFQNEMHMIIRKQLHNTNKSIKYRGIVAVTSAIKHIVNLAENSQEITMDLETTYNSISELPSGPVRMAAELLQMATDSNSRYPLALGLYYDQLAQAVVNCQNMDPRFVQWLNETCTTEFQNAYIVSEVPENDTDIKFEVLYDLNEKGSVDVEIIINIGVLALDSSLEKNNSLITLAPLFRLVRLLNQRQYTDSLDNIDALLGCGIYFPELDPDLGIENFGLEDSRKVLNCLFYTINYFRELISAFVTQKGSSIKQKVLKRLTNLIELEEKLIEYSKVVPDHKLPLSHFYNVDNNQTMTSINEPHQSKGKKRPKSNLNATSATQKPTQTQSKSKAKPAKNFEIGPIKHFRELDTDLILLLKLPLDFDVTESSDLTLTLPQFNFITQDLVTKLQIFNSGQSNLSHLNKTSNPNDLVIDCIKLMPYLNGHLIHLDKKIEEILERNDGIHDAAEMFNDQTVLVKRAHTLILEVLSLIFNWGPLKCDLGQLREALKGLLSQKKSQKLRAASDLMNEVLLRFGGTIENCLTLKSAVALTNVVKCFTEVTLIETADIKKKLRVLAGKFLERKWFNLQGLLEIGASANVLLNNLILCHFEGADITTIRHVVDILHEEVEKLQNKDDFLTSFNCINKNNFPMLYRTICGALLDALNEDLKIGKTNEKHLDLWYDVVTTLHKLMDIVKMQENRSNLKAFLKKTTGILKIFLSHGLPIFELTLRTNTERVIEIMKILQQSTRFAQNLCCHSKVSKDLGLVSFVPQLKLTLETLVYRVKALLAANNCSEGFWMGNLRNKNLRGEDILTQMSNESSQNNEDSDNLPPDDSDVENENENENKGSDDDSRSICHEDDNPKSLSEIF